MIRDHHALVAFLEGHRATPFAYGPTGLDCARFAAGAVKAQTGHNPLRRLGHRWSTSRSALRVLARFGGMAAACDSVMEAIPPGAAKRGDVAGVPNGTGDLLLMIVEGTTLVGLAEGGLQRLPRSLMTHAWSAA